MSLLHLKDTIYACIMWHVQSITFWLCKPLHVHGTSTHTYEALKHIFFPSRSKGSQSICCHSRKKYMRPQHNIYDFVEKQIWALFKWPGETSRSPSICMEQNLGAQQQNQDPQPNFQYGPRTTFKNKESCPAHFPTFLTKRLHCPPWSCLISLLEP